MNLKPNINSFFSFNNVNLFFVMSIAFLMPFHKYTPELTIYWFIIWLFERNYLKKDNYLPKANKIVFFSLMLYFLYMVFEFALLNFSREELREIDYRIGFLFFSLIFLFANNKIKKNINKILLIFTISCTTLSLKKIIVEGLIYNFTYVNFAGSAPAWFSMYNLLAISINFYLFDTNKKSKLSIILYIIANLILITAIFFASSRSGIVILIIILLFQFVSIVKKYKKIKVVMLFIIVFVVVFAIKQPRMQQLNQESGTIRIYLNLVGFKVLKDNFKSIKKTLFGIGEIKCRNEFNNYLIKEPNVSEGAKHLDKSHNSYLSVFIKRGLLGEILFLFFLGLPLFNSIKEKNLLLLSFLIIIMVNFLFEETFTIRSGTYFFSFFYCLLNLQSAILHKEIGIDEEI